MQTDLADVLYQEQKVGVIFWDAPRRVAVFEYTPEFIASGLELAPLQMPLRNQPYQFPRLHDSYAGLPGLLADSLPDVYGKVLIDEWIRRQGRDPDGFTPVERLCYVGDRGMGALEFRPSLRKLAPHAEKVAVDRLVELASEALRAKEGLSTELRNEEDITEILRVGTSAGGARAKAVVALNEATNEVRSGQASVPAGFNHWILKLDGVTASFDGVREPQGYGRIEYAYHLMAVESGIRMMECRLFEEGGRAHFMTRRFDRPNGAGRLHYASLFGLTHMAYGAPWEVGHAYEDYLKTVVSGLHLAPEDRIEAFRRMAFNVLGCNRDDHSKNFGFLMQPNGAWGLSPAFDITYAHNPAPEKWTAVQQMSVLGKREAVTASDLIECGRICGIGTIPRLKGVIAQVSAALHRWPEFANNAGVGEREREAISVAVQAQSLLQ